MYIGVQTVNSRSVSWPTFATLETRRSSSSWPRLCTQSASAYTMSPSVEQYNYSRDLLTAVQMLAREWRYYNSAKYADFPFECPQVSLISRPDLDFELGGAAAIMEMTGLHQLLR